MDFYKRILRSRTLRLKILDFLSFIPDKPMTSFQYRVKTGRRMNWKNPRRFTEKLQVYKTYYRNPLMIPCSDKGDVRDYVASCGLADILVGCCGIYNTFDEIDFNALPNRFAAKDTLGGGGSSVIVCRDKSRLDPISFEKELRSWTARPYHTRNEGREWPYYSGKKHRIIVEQFLDSGDPEEEPVDYKFFCFYGEPKFMYVMADRKLGKGAQANICDADYNLLPYNIVGKSSVSRSVPKPKNFEQMLEISRILAKPFPQVRVDLYNLDGQIYFGELTFYSATGYMRYDPDEFDFLAGEYFDLYRETENGVWNNVPRR